MVNKYNLPNYLQDLLRNDEEVIHVYNHRFRQLVSYIITNLRIINCKKKKNIKSYYYSQLFKIESYSVLFGSAINLHTQPDLDPSQSDGYLGLVSIADLPEGAKDIIEKAWFPQSPYYSRIRPFEQLAQKYNLNLIPIELNGNNIISLKGEINGLKTSITLSNIYKLNQLHIILSCPNSENNYLSIVPEKASDGIKKLFGKQDIITKDRKFDNRFLLQSDHQSFFDFVMTPDIIKELYDSSHYIEADIIFGLKKAKGKKKKENKATEFDILDEHLLEELPTIIEHNDSLYSALSLQANQLRKKLFNIDVVLAHSIQYFEVVLKIANRIKEYNEKHI